MCATGKFGKSSLLQVQCVTENKYFPIFLAPRRQNFAIKTPAGHPIPCIPYVICPYLNMVLCWFYISMLVFNICCSEHSKTVVKCSCHINRHVECHRFDSGIPHVNCLAKKEQRRTVHLTEKSSLSSYQTTRNSGWKWRLSFIVTLLLNR